MNNTSLRERFGIEAKNSAMVSRIIKQAVKSGKIKAYDDAAGAKAKRYVPWVGIINLFDCCLTHLSI